MFPTSPAHYTSTCDDHLSLFPVGIFFCRNSPRRSDASRTSTVDLLFCLKTGLQSLQTRSPSTTLQRAYLQTWTNLWNLNLLAALCGVLVRSHQLLALQLYSRRKDPIMQKISAIEDLQPDQMTRLQLLCAWTPQMILDRTTATRDDMSRCELDPAIRMKQPLQSGAQPKSQPKGAWIGLQLWGTSDKRSVEEHKPSSNKRPAENQKLNSKSRTPRH